MKYVIAACLLCAACTRSEEEIEPSDANVAIDASTNLKIVDQQGPIVGGNITLMTKGVAVGVIPWWTDTRAVDYPNAPENPNGIVLSESFFCPKTGMTCSVDAGIAQCKCK